MRRSRIVPILAAILLLPVSFDFYGKSDAVSTTWADPQASPQPKEREKIPAEKGLGTEEITRPDGGKDTVYYSITTPGEESKARAEEKEKTDRSMDVLRNVIIDPRRR